LYCPFAKAPAMNNSHKAAMPNMQYPGSKSSSSKLALILASASLLLPVPAAPADDWPNFRGPNHDGISSGTGLAAKWPDTGPKVVWTREVGAAFSSFAVVGDRLYTCGAEDKQQVLFCLKAATGDVVWKRAFEPEYTDPDPHLYGTRATPTVDGGRVYIMAPHAHVFCFDAATGKQIWSRAFGAKPGWGYSGSVLIEGGMAIVTAGGSDGSLCAMDKKTGDVIWKCGDDPAAYATPYPFTLDGKRYICGFMGQSVIVAEAKTGKPVLRFEWPSHSGVNACSPIFHDGHLLISTGYGYGAGLFKLKPEGDVLRAAEVWRSRKIRNKFQSPVLFEGNLYTSDENGLKCADFMTGKLHWRKGGIRHGTIVLAGGYLGLLTETGELQVAPASPDGFEPNAKAKPFEGNSYSAFQRLTRQQQGARCWTTPVLCGHRLYVRDHTRVKCLDLRDASSTGR
ncbi:MAG: PQQ-like beta-propeller repeat protein, partial [Planctomycetota bacterium]|nr:PQQ-like beta-propeller repeat protein [Planctomycetota bacterium]